MEQNAVVADLYRAAGLIVDADQGDFHAQHNSRYHPHFDPHWRVAQMGVQQQLGLWPFRRLGACTCYSYYSHSHG
jgi:hypothetical protein